MLIPKQIKSFSFNDRTGFYRFVTTDDRVCLYPMHLLDKEMIDFVADKESPWGEPALCITCNERKAVTNCGNYCLKCWKIIVREGNPLDRDLSRFGTEHIGRPAISTQVLGGQPTTNDDNG